jgi:hypothetical protein
MATIYTEPLNSVINYSEWGKLIQKTTFEAGGFIALGLTNMATTDAPQIAQGSRVEIGGSLYVCESNETITSTPSSDGLYYIYGIPNASSASFSYSGSKPTYNAVKGGWYNGNDRAIAKLFYTSSQYNGKVILDSYNAFFAINTEQPIPTTGGQLVITGTVNQVKKATLQPGAYRYDIKAGRGGDGGGNGLVGIGADGEVKTGTFILTEPRVIHYALGGDGNDGASNPDTDDPGGGGGCSGGSAFIDTGDDFILCLGGSGGGGKGGAGDIDQNGAGGGGAAGYGRGGDGGYGSAYDGQDFVVSNGKGGNNGVGGNGGVHQNRNGGGGSGYLSGGTGYENGGGYGEKGGNGQGNSSGSYKGGVGGNSSTGETVSPTDKYPHKIQYQAGGGGGYGYIYNGCDGGSGLKSTSSGYLRIYKTW